MRKLDTARTFFSSTQYLWAFMAVFTVGLEIPQAVAQSVQPNFVVVLVDDMRWDDFGAGGHPFVQTPNIDRVAREGVLFTNAFTTTPLCSPARASFLTGLYSHTHGIIDNTDRAARSRQLKTFPHVNRI